MVFIIIYEPWEWGCWGGDKEDELTHYGQSLSEIEKFDDPVISDDEDEDEGRINGI